MSDPSRRHSKRGTINIAAAFIPDDAEQRFDMMQLVGNLGAGMLRFAGVLVPPGGSPPGYPFVEFGEFQQDLDAGAEGLSSDGMSLPPSHSGVDQWQPASQHEHYVVRAARRGPKDRSSATVVTVPQTDRPVAPFPGSQGSQRQGGMQDDAIAAALIAFTTQPSYADISELVRHAVPGMRREAPSSTGSPGDDARNLPDDIAEPG